MGEMLKFLVLVHFVMLCSKAECDVKCKNGFEANKLFEPSSDGVKGRYTLTWCTKAEKNITKWETTIRFNNLIRSEQCNQSSLSFKSKRRKSSFSLHSKLKYDVNLDCGSTDVCLSTSVDLIFESCYKIQNIIYIGDESLGSPQENFFYAENNFMDYKTLSDFTPLVSTIEYEDYVSSTWYLEPIPVATFKMDLCKKNATPHQDCEDVTQNCTAELYCIVCQVSPEHGAYSLRLSQHAPWTAGDIAKFVVDSPPFDFYGLKEPSVEGGRVWGAAAAALALALAAVLALAAWRLRSARSLRGRVLKAWRHRNDSESTEAMGEEGTRLLLLYARDCAPMMEVVRQLRVLLEAAAPGRVYDLFTPAVGALAAPAPGDWLRALIAHPDTKVLLLQTPAAACLYGTQLRQRGAHLALQRPLLGARVVARAPHAADTLLQLALRLVSDAAAAPAAHAAHALPYKKYFVAEIPGLEAELVPLVTPQRRYALPQGAALLLGDLFPQGPWAGRQPQPWEQLLLPLQQAVAALLDYISEYPDYLNDELLFL